MHKQCSPRASGERGRRALIMAAVFVASSWSSVALADPESSDRLTEQDAWLSERSAASEVHVLDVDLLIQTEEPRPRVERRGRAIEVKPLLVFGSPPKPRHEELEAIVATQTLRQRQGALQRCYQRALQRDGSTSGSLVVDLGVDTHGSVVGANVVRDGVRSRALTVCVFEALANVRFDRQPEEGAIVTARFVFRPSSS